MTYRTIIADDGPPRVLGEFPTLIQADNAGRAWKTALRGNGTYYVVDVPPRATTFRKIAP